MSTFILKNCPKCGQQHEKTGLFCSRSCANSRGPRTQDFKARVAAKLKNRPSPHKGKIKVERVQTNCVVCHAPVLTTDSELQRRASVTCLSFECVRETHSRAGKASAAKRVLRSKDEIELFELCKSVYGSAQPNTIIADGWDADIVIPELKIAVLWHGPWHYRDMKMHNHSLRQVKNRDRIKRELFASLGWKVMEFKDCDYTPREAFEAIMVEGRGYAPLP